jgi:hypothetical protein
LSGESNEHGVQPWKVRFPDGRTFWLYQDYLCLAFYRASQPKEFGYRANGEATFALEETHSFAIENHKDRKQAASMSEFFFTFHVPQA